MVERVGQAVRGLPADCGMKEVEEGLVKGEGAEVMKGEGARRCMCWWKVRGAGARGDLQEAEMVGML